jgi:hypothetical protein
LKLNMSDFDAAMDEAKKMSQAAGSAKSNVKSIQLEAEQVSLFSCYPSVPSYPHVHVATQKHSCALHVPSYAPAPLKSCVGTPRYSNAAEKRWRLCVEEMWDFYPLSHMKPAAHLSRILDYTPLFCLLVRMRLL